MQLNNIKIFRKIILVDLILVFLLSFKLNNKIYYFLKLKNLYFLNYFQSKQILFNFCILKVKKICFLEKKIRNNVS